MPGACRPARSQHLEGSGDDRCPHALCSFRRGCLLGFGQVREVDPHRGQEGVAQLVQHPLADGPRITALRSGVGQRGQRTAGVLLAEGVQQGLDRVVVPGDAAGGDDPVEGREGVPGGAAALPQGLGDAVLLHLEAGVLDDPADVGLQLGGRQQAELQVLRAAADRGQDLLGVGRGQDEDHVVRRLLQRLQEGGRRPLRQHVDLVQDVEAGTARAGQRRTGDEITHVVDAGVRGGVQLGDVERASRLDRLARGTDPARLTVDRGLAVEDLGQDPRRRRLARPPRPTEQVGVPEAVLRGGVPQRRHHVVLPHDLVEPLRPIPPIKRLKRHRGGDYKRAVKPKPERRKEPRHEAVPAERCRGTGAAWPPR